MKSIVVLLLGLFAESFCASASAQDVPVVFVHGLKSSASTWQETSQRLTTETRIRPYLPDPDWTETFEVQAIQIDQQLGPLPPSVIFMGHSNGGVVARQWSLTHPTSAIVTIGTPHRGAPLVVGIASIIVFSKPLIDEGATLGWIVENDLAAGWEDVIADVLDNIGVGGGLLLDSVSALSNTLGLLSPVPVLDEMVPASPYMLRINSTTNLNRETAEIPARVGIVSTAHNWYWGGPIRAAWPDDGDRRARLRDLANYALDETDFWLTLNSDPYDSIAQTIRRAAHISADVLHRMDGWWCLAVGPAGGGYCWPNDTVVPVWTQQYPADGSTTIIVNDGPAHTQETHMGYPWLKDALTRLAHVPPR